MIHASNTWTEVETKLAELRLAVDDKWDHGDWETALTGEKLLGSVKKSIENAAAMRRQANKLVAKLELIEAYRQFPLA
jgi:DNA-binding transcriptional regulator PaaX